MNSFKIRRSDGKYLAVSVGPIDSEFGWTDRGDSWDHARARVLAAEYGGELVPAMAPGEVIDTALYGKITLIRRITGVAKIDGWEALDSTKRTVYMSDSDFDMKPEEAIEIRRLIGKMSPS